MLGDSALIQDAPSTAPRTSGPAKDHPTPGEEDSNFERLGGLVLTRRLLESIMIGDEVEVQVVGLRSGTVKLKVIAPRSIRVDRREVFDAIRSEPVPARPASDPRPGKPGGGLVLARSARQSIMIGEDVEIGVVEVRPSTVKLRISAPRSVKVDRREVYESRREGL